tara:strand:+ start:1479 stop:1742 length:264 start_codon:yes stop_codon:yes gene_type:complete
MKLVKKDSRLYFGEQSDKNNSGPSGPLKAPKWPSILNPIKGKEKDMETHFIDQIRATKDPGNTLMMLYSEDMISADEFEWIYTEIFE